jgi:hypothetical protein
MRRASSPERDGKPKRRPSGHHGGVRCRPTLVLALLALPLLLAACVAETPPAAPDVEDPNFEAVLGRTWNLAPDGLIEGHRLLDWVVEAPEGVESVAVWLEGEQVSRLAGGPTFAGTVELEGLAPGEYELLFAEKGAEVAFAMRTFLVSAPLYVLISVDWDRADTIDSELAWQEELHADHPALRLTHFVGPWTFTEPEMAADRMELLVDWLLLQEADHDDEIGLHIHPYCSFVETTSVPCRHEPSFAYDTDETGYTVVSAAYSVAEYTELLLAADDIFEANGLPRPTSYRAGGWTADAGTLQALAAAGHVADTSAVNHSMMEEWIGQGSLYDWNVEHWGPIGPTSQPYYPSVADAAVAGEPSIPVLEVPDNAILADYAEAWEVIEVLEANWDGGFLAGPKVLSYGYHNRTAGTMWTYRDRVEGTLDHVDQHLAAVDGGPLVYATLTEMASVWPAP